MKNLESLSDNQFIDHLTYVGRLYRKRFHKDLGITREVGEYKASKLDCTPMTRQIRLGESGGIGH